MKDKEKVPNFASALLTLEELAGEPGEEIKRLFGPMLDPSITLLHAPAGAGKSMLAHEIALAVSTGKSDFTTGPLPGWYIGEVGPVLLVDGELPIDELRRRLVGLRKGRTAGAAIHLLANAQLFDLSLPPIDISSRQGRDAIESLVEELNPRLLILDNLATLTSEFYDEDGAGAQRSINLWQAALRESGVSVILIHHDNKSGKQRGSSDRETICDLIIHITRLQDSAINQAAFNVSFEKARFLASNPVEFNATLRDGKWGFSDTASGMMGKFLSHMDEVGEFVWRDIASELSISKPYTYRLHRVAVEKGIWNFAWKGPRRRAKKIGARVKVR